MNSPGKNKNMYKLPSRDNHYCFGCSPVNEHGLKMEFYTDTTRVYSDLTIPDHLCGWNSLAHGGVLSTILDEIMSWSAIYILKRVIMTKSMTVDFKKPVKVGERLHVKGSVKEKINEREALMEGFILNEKGEICATSKGTFALFTIDAIRKMNIMDTDDIEALEELFDAGGYPGKE